MKKNRTLFFSTKLKPVAVKTKNGRKALRDNLKAAKQNAWADIVNRGRKNGAVSIGRLAPFIASPILCPEMGAFPDHGWEIEDGLPELFLEGTVNKTVYFKDTIVWHGISLDGVPPNRFYQHQHEYVLLPPEGLSITCIEKFRYLPVLTASEIDRLAVLNQRNVASPGQDRVFGLAFPKVNRNGDFYEDGVFYFVTPTLFSEH